MVVLPNWTNRRIKCLQRYLTHIDRWIILGSNQHGLNNVSIPVLRLLKNFRDYCGALFSGQCQIPWLNSVLAIIWVEDRRLVQVEVISITIVLVDRRYLTYCNCPGTHSGVTNAELLSKAGERSDYAYYSCFTCEVQRSLQRVDISTQTCNPE